MKIGLVDIDGHAKKKKWGATIYPKVPPSDFQSERPVSPINKGKNPRAGMRPRSRARLRLARSFQHNGTNMLTITRWYQK